MNRITTMQLIDSNTRQPLVIGQKVATFRGEEAELIAWREPHKPDSNGLVYVKMSNGLKDEFYPSVIGAEFFPRPDRED